MTLHVFTVTLDETWVYLNDCNNNNNDNLFIIKIEEKKMNKPFPPGAKKVSVSDL